MKKLTTVLLLGTLSLFLVTSCGDKDNSSEVETDDSTPVTKRKMGSDSSSIAIAYYVQDSLVTQFNFFREMDSILSAKQLSFEKELESRIRNYRLYEQDIQKRMDAGEITGYDIESIQQTAMQKQQAIQQFEQQRGGAIQQEKMENTRALMNKIAEAGREFSEKNDIDLLFFYQKGGQINYIADAFDVTSDFIKFLNKREEQMRTGYNEEVKAIKEDSSLLDDNGLNPALNQ